MYRGRIPLSGSLKIWNGTNWRKFKSCKHFQISETSFPNLLMFWLQNVKQMLFKRQKKWRMLYWLTWTVLPEARALNSIHASTTTLLVHYHLMFMSEQCYLLQVCFPKVKVLFSSFFYYMQTLQNTVVHITCSFNLYLSVQGKYDYHYWSKKKRASSGLFFFFRVK